MPDMRGRFVYRGRQQWAAHSMQGMRRRIRLRRWQHGSHVHVWEILCPEQRGVPRLRYGESIQSRCGQRVLEVRPGLVHNRGELGKNENAVHRLPCRVQVRGEGGPGGVQRGALFFQRKCRLPTVRRRHAVQRRAERDVPNLPPGVGDIGRGKRRHVSYDVYFVCGR